MEEKIRFLEQRYNSVLQIVEIQKKAKDETHKFFKLGNRWKYQNPFYDKFDDALQKIRDSTISFIIRIFENKYLNVDLNSDEFDKCLSKDKWGNKGLEIDFNKVILKIKELENKAEDLAKEQLIKKSLILVPYSIKKESYDKERIFKFSEIQKGNKLILYCGYGYSNPNTSNVHQFLRLINVVLRNKKFSQAKESEEVGTKYYKNGRVDIIFNNKTQAEFVAKFLEQNQ